MTRHQICHRVSELVRSADHNKNYSICFFARCKTDGQLLLKSIPWDSENQCWKMNFDVFSTSIGNCIDHIIAYFQPLGELSFIDIIRHR